MGWLTKFISKKWSTNINGQVGHSQSIQVMLIQYFLDMEEKVFKTQVAKPLKSGETSD